MQSSGVELDLKSDPNTTRILLQFALGIKFKYITNYYDNINHNI